MAWLSALWTIIWKCTLFFTLWGILLTPFILPVTQKLKENDSAYAVPVRLYLEFSGALTILVAAWVMAQFVDGRSFSSLGFAPAQWARDSLLGVGLGSLWLLSSVGALWIFGWAIAQIPTTIAVPKLALAGLAMILNTVTQEVLARSYIYQTIETHSTPLVAVSVSAFIFMLYHAGGLKGHVLAALNVVSAGILFGVAFHLTGNLWFPIAIHFAWNFLLGPVLGLSISGQQWTIDWQLFTLQGSPLMTGGNFGIEGSLVVTITTILTIIALWQLKPL